MTRLALACALLALPLAASAQSLPSMPKMPGGGMPSMPGASSTPGLPGTSTASSSPTGSIDQMKTEMMCKIPTNATKPECIELMLKK